MVIVQFMIQVRININLVPKSHRCLPAKNKFPKLLESELIAPNCTVIGDVTTGRKSSFYFGVIVNAENCKIKVGKNTIVQDNTIILSSKGNEVTIGDNVTIGTNCYIDGATIGDNAVIGNGASIYSGAIIESNAFIAPGSVIGANVTVNKNQIWVGNPAKYLRDVLPEEKENIAENLSELSELSGIIVDETEKTQQDLISDEYLSGDMQLLDIQQQEYLYKNLVSYHTKDNYDELGIEAQTEGYGDINDEGMIKTNFHNNLDKYLHTKYEQDLSNYPDYFKIYNENYKKYDDIEKNAENIGPGEYREIFETSNLRPERPGALRAWTSKWDPDYNVTYKGVGSRTEGNNHY